MKKLVLGMLLSVTGLAFGGVGEIYVNVQHQDAGDTPIEGRGGVDLPYKTLQAAMGHAGLASGDTVWVAPGVYNEGGAEAGSNSNRVVVVAGVTVRATGSKEETIIEGFPDPDTLKDSTLKGIGPKAVRCAYLHSGAVIRGFTLRNGRCRENNDTSGYGGCARYGTMIDCVITGNHGRRGGALANTTLIRCLLKGNTCCYTGNQTIGCSFYNCIVIDTSGYGTYQNGTVVNSTFIGASGVYTHAPSAAVYNSLFSNYGVEGNSAALTFSNTIMASATISGTNKFTFISCVLTKDLTQAKVNTRYAPGPNTPAIDRCTDYAAYKALFPAGFQDEADYDFYGNPRRRAGAESFSCGAVEYEPDADGLTEIRVDAENGDDTYEDPTFGALVRGNTKHPYKTLQAAMDDERVGKSAIIQTVLALPGTYSEGGHLAATSACTTTNRVNIKEGVTLKSTEGASKTFIVGATRVRCVYLQANACLQGFTVQDAVINDDTTISDTYRNGGGASGAATAAIFDCTFTNCVAHRGGAIAFSGTVIRCRFVNNRCGLTGDAVYDNASYYNCFFDNRTESGYMVYSTAKLVNCTFIGGVNTTFGHNFGNAYNCVFLCPYESLNTTKILSACGFGYSSAPTDTALDPLCDAACVRRKSAAELKVSGTCVPLPDSLVRNICTDYAAYKALFPTAFQDEADYDLNGQPRCNGSDTTFDAGCFEYNDDYLPYRSEWYVDPVNGDDSYTGDDKGFSEHPYKTLQAAMENTYLSARHTVWARPGTYNEGGYYNETRQETIRVKVPEGVSLISTDGANKTFIVGQPGTGKSAGSSGIGAGSVRCVQLNADAFLKGFTVKSGYASDTAEAGYGGGVQGSSNSVMEDCVVRECCAGRNNAAYVVIARRCSFVDNYAGGIGLVGASKIYNCFFGTQLSNMSYLALYCSVVENCTFMHKGSISAVHAQDYSKKQAKNCLFVGASSPESTKTVIFTNCVFASGYFTSLLDESSKVYSLADLKIDAEGRPQVGSPLIDAGDDTLYTSADAGTLDQSRWLRTVGAHIDIGAFEYDATRSKATLVDAAGVVEIPAFGSSTVAQPAYGETLTYTILRKLGGSRLARGVSINGTMYAFTDYPAGITRTLPTTGVSETIESVLCDTWYVDAVNGSDANLGETAESAKETFLGTIGTNTYFAAGDTVKVLPGEYTNGIFNVNDKWIRCRLQVPANTQVLALEGPEKTIIRGARAYGAGLATGDLGTKWGLGSNTVRTVRALAGSVVRGFTLADGACYSSSAYSADYDTGGNVAAADTAYIVDCIITNGVAQRGGGAAGGRFVNCLFTGNIGAHIGATLNAKCHLFGCIVEKSKNSYIWHNSAGKGSTCYVVNTLFAADNASSSVRDVSSTTYCYNSIDLMGAAVTSGEGLPMYYRSLVKGKNGTFSDNCVTNLTAAQIAALLNGSVPAKDGLACDAGNNDYYDLYWPTAFKDEFRDVNGSQRIYNGAIDIGPGEYDWRADFAQNLRRRRLEILSASPNVTLGEGKTLDLAAGSTLSLRLAFAGTGTARLTVAGEGSSIVVKQGETVLTPSAEGVYTFAGEGGSDYDVSIAVADADATLSNVRIPGKSFLLIYR